MKTLRRAALSLTTLILAAATFGSGCSVEGDGLEGKPESDGKLVDGKAEAWNYTNNPNRFRLDFNHKYAELPASGQVAQTPWPDTYWPTYKDSSNQRWQGVDEMSPVEKYDLAFNGWEPPENFMELRPFQVGNCDPESWDPEYYDNLGNAASWMSKNKGNWKAHDGVDSDGDGEVDECDDNDGVETWWGLCHAWVPASILENEPKYPVTYNGVTFTVGDIKGLLQTVYDRASAYMLGGRCNEKEVERDDEGRLTQPQCRDTNAGAFHVVLTNMVGVMKRSFAEDRTYDYEVWNQPMHSYEILEQEDVDAVEAMKRLGHEEATEYTFNDDATKFAYVKTRVKYLTEPHQTSTEPLVPAVDNEGRYLGTDTYEYILEMNDAGEIIGGEWLEYSQTSHPDFLWLPIAARGGNPFVDIDTVKELVELSQEDGTQNPEAEIRTFESTMGADIPDNDPAGAATTLEVTEDINVGSLSVHVDIEHSYIGDLQVTLEKDGVSVVLHDREGGGADDINKSFEVSEFNGVSAKGTWTLKVVDRANRDVGKIAGFTLNVSTAAAAPAFEAASGNVGISIPDDDDAGIESVIRVEESGQIKGLKVKVDLDHTYIGDLKLELVHGGLVQGLHAREGGSSDDIKKTFTVDGFNGGDIAGEWTLRVSDHAGADLGTLNSWSILATLN